MSEPKNIWYWRWFPILLLVWLAGCGTGDESGLCPPGENRDAQGQCQLGPRFSEDTPADVQQLVLDYWPQIWLALPGWKECAGRITVAGDWGKAGELGSSKRGRYLDGVIYLSIPATAARLEHALLHELGHHIDASCPDLDLLRTQFLASQGFAEETEWFAGVLEEKDRTDHYSQTRWEDLPTEQFAEAVVRVVRGRPDIYYDMTIRPEALELVAEWGRQGDPDKSG